MSNLPTIVVPDAIAKRFVKYRGKRILVCGDRRSHRVDQVYEVLDALDPGFIVQGGGDGAERVAQNWAFAHEVPFCIVPAHWGAARLRDFDAEARQHRWFFMLELVVAFPGAPRGILANAKEAEVPVLEFHVPVKVDFWRKRHDRKGIGESS